MVVRSEDAKVLGLGEQEEAEVAQIIQEIDWVDEGDGGTVPKPKCGGLFKSDKGEVVLLLGQIQMPRSTAIRGVNSNRSGRLMPRLVIGIGIILKGQLMSANTVPEESSRS